jgi:virginiamycin A acetyltransferase
LPYPTPDTVHPVTLPDGSRLPNNVFLKAAMSHPRFDVGRYTYANDFDPLADPADWAGRLAPYLYPQSPDRLVIGAFCQIAHGVRFITHSANHAMDGFSTYPFAIHDPARFETLAAEAMPGRDTIVGHDVWLGMEARVMPGSRVGSGVIAGAGAVIAGDVPDYAVVAGNPARVVRMRFDAATIRGLLGLAWWDWPIETILAHEEAIVGADLAALERAAPR